MRYHELIEKSKTHQLTELGDSPAEHEPNRRRKRSLFHATVDNQWVDVFFDRSDLNGTLHITFTVNDNYEAPHRPTQASKSTIKILSTVLAIVKQRLPQYMEQTRPPAVSFTAKGDNRSRVYRKYFVPVIQDILGSKWQLTEYSNMGMTVFNWRPSKKQGVAEGGIKDLDIDLQDQQWEAVVGRVQHGVRRGEDLDRMSLALYRWAGSEMFDMDDELERRGFDSVPDLADHIQAHGGRYVPPEFDLGSAGSLKDIERMPRQRPDDVRENFADGKKPGRKGLAKRVGVNCKQSVSKLRSIAKNSSGERQRMAHWCANMKSGRKK